MCLPKSMKISLYLLKLELAKVGVISLRHSVVTAVKLTTLTCVFL